MLQPQITLEDTMLSKSSGPKRPQLRFHLHELSRVGKSIETDSMVARAWEKRELGEQLLMGANRSGSPFGVMRMFWN